MVDREIALPTTLKVGYNNFKIEVMNPKSAQKQNIHGLCSWPSSSMQINTSYGPTDAADTLVHEALHCIWRLMDLGLSREKEERVVTTMSKGICTIMVDNPEFFPKVQELLEAGTDVSVEQYREKD